MIRTVVWCGSRLRPYPQATRRTFSEARTQSLATLPRRWVGSEGSEIIAHATQKGRRVTTNLWQYQQNFSEASKNIAPATQKESRVTIMSPMICTCHTKRRWNHKKCSEASKKYCACHTKRTYRVTQSRGTSRNVTVTFSEVSKILHLPHKQNVYTRNFSEPSRILHLPHKKQVGSPVSPNIGSQSTSRRH